MIRRSTQFLFAALALTVANPLSADPLAPQKPPRLPGVKAPDRPTGVWVRDVGPVKVVLKLTADRLTATAVFATGNEEWPVVRATLDAEFAVAKDGTLFGVVFGADATQPMYAAVFQPLDGQPFAFGWRVDGDTLTVRNLKWLGFGLPTEKAAEFAELPVLGNGRYTRMDEAKLPEWEKKLTGTATPLMRTVVGGGLTAPPTQPAPSAPPLFRHVPGTCEAPTAMPPVPPVMTPPPQPSMTSAPQVLVPAPQPVPPTTVIPTSAEPIVRPGGKTETTWGSVPVLPPLRDGATPDAPSPPCIHDVLKALPPAPRGVPFVFAVSRENLGDAARVVKELESEKLDPPRFYPVIGIARGHHATWKCTVTFPETITSGFPFYFTATRERVEVVWVPQMSLYQYVLPEPPAAPPGEPSKVSNGAGSVVPAGGVAPANPLHGTWVREKDGMQAVLNFADKRLHVEINAAMAIPGEKGAPIRFTQSLDADYSTSPDGTVFGILTGIDVTLGEGLPPEAYGAVKEARRDFEKMIGAMFKFRTRLDGGRMTLSEARASMFDAVRTPNGDVKADTNGLVCELFGGRFERVIGKVPPPKLTAGGFFNQYSEDPNVRIEQLQKPQGEQRQKGTGLVPPPTPLAVPKCKDCAPPLKPTPGRGEPVTPIPIARS